MKFDLKNIGPIKEASIKVDGLTVITGENSIGKSAIGKAIFCLMDASRNVLIDIILNHRSIYQQKIIEIQSLLPLGDLYGNITTELQLSKLYYSKKNDKEKDQFENHISLANQYVNQLLKGYKYENKILNIIDDLQSVYLINSDKIEERLSKKFNFLIKYVFNDSINNKNNFKKSGHIKFDNKNDKVAFFEFKKDKTSKSIIFKRSHLKEVILIESPLILSLYRFIKDSLAFNRNSSPYNGLPYHTFDLIKKISEKHYADNHLINREIGNIISGNVDFDENINDFIFKDKNNKKHDIVNVASGIKAFGILQLLATSERFNKDNILIIDEPEVHLHPFWQIEYAKILVKLVENDIPVVVASHSPYFIEALKTYSDKTIKDKTNFYLGEMQEGGSVFKDVTDDLEPIFELLAIPMQQLMLDNH
jgi:predicted ATP-dependent endonuclease of OLD family